MATDPSGNIAFLGIPLFWWAAGGLMAGGGAAYAYGSYSLSNPQSSFALSPTAARWTQATGAIAFTAGASMAGGWLLGAWSVTSTIGTGVGYGLGAIGIYGTVAQAIDLASNWNRMDAVDIYESIGTLAASWVGGIAGAKSGFRWRLKSLGAGKTVVGDSGLFLDTPQNSLAMRATADTVLGDARFTIVSPWRTFLTEVFWNPFKLAFGGEGFDRANFARAFRQVFRAMITDILPWRAKITLSSARMPPEGWSGVGKFGLRDYYIAQLALDLGLPIVTTNKGFPGQLTGKVLFYDFGFSALVKPKRVFVVGKDFSDAQGLWGLLR